MNNSYFWIQIGIKHILTIEALDHLLFIGALTCIYNISEWKKILINITAFTMGHSISLALSVLKIISLDNNLIEFLIPLTIAFTSIQNIITTFKKTESNALMIYLITLLFGVIHGIGFSNLLIQMLDKESIILPLFSFNIGIEIAQLIVVGVFLMMAFILIKLLKIKQNTYIYSTSFIIFIVSIYLTINRL